MKKIKKIVLGAVLAFSLTGVGFILGNIEDSVKVTDNSNSTEFDLKLPGEVEKRTVTKSEVVSRIREIGELSTYCGEYNFTKTVDQSRYFLDDVKIPGTKNTISIEGTGNVKVGYEMADIKVSVEKETIYISIPEAKVTDNYIIWDSLKYDEQNNILNPIQFDQYETLIEEIEKEGLADVEKKEIYEKADENLENIISVFLSEFNGYKIKFM